MKKLTYVAIAIAMVIGTSCQKDQDEFTPQTNQFEEVQHEIAYPERSGEIVDVDFNGEVLTFEKIDDRYVFEGDIIFSPEDIKYYQERSNLKGCGITSSSRKWRNKTIPYTLGSGLSSARKNKISAAIKKINSETDLNIKYRRGESDYVEFIPSSGAWSYIGRIGGKQQIGTPNWASTGTMIHEIFHAAGIYHEQSRIDRDKHVTIHWKNIQSGKSNNFKKAPSRNAKDFGSFSLNSIMMYGPKAFSKNGRPTITKKNGSTYKSQRRYISRSDKAAINRMY